jgi:hypothetical protein
MRGSLWRRSAVALLAVLVAGKAARAQESSEPGPPDPHRHPSHTTAAGKLEGYDPLTRVLTVRNATGSAEFRVAADARVWLGNRRLPVNRLGAHAGAQVTVAWSETGGVRTTHTVRVSDGRASRGE